MHFKFWTHVLARSHEPYCIGETSRLVWVIYQAHFHCKLSLRFSFHLELKGEEDLKEIRIPVHIGFQLESCQTVLGEWSPAHRTILPQSHTSWHRRLAGHRLSTATNLPDLSVWRERAVNLLAVHGNVQNSWQLVYFRRRCRRLFLLGVLQGEKERQASLYHSSLSRREHRPQIVDKPTKEYGHLQDLPARLCLEINRKHRLGLLLGSRLHGHPGTQANSAKRFDSCEFTW